MHAWIFIKFSGFYSLLLFIWPLRYERPKKYGTRTSHTGLSAYINIMRSESGKLNSTTTIWRRAYSIVYKYIYTHFLWRQFSTNSNDIDPYRPKWVRVNNKHALACNNRDRFTFMRCRVFRCVLILSFVFYVFFPLCRIRLVACDRTGPRQSMRSVSVWRDDKNKYDRIWANNNEFFVVDDAAEGFASVMLFNVYFRSGPGPDANALYHTDINKSAIVRLIFPIKCRQHTHTCMSSNILFPSLTKAHGKWYVKVNSSAQLIFTGDH